MRLFLKPFLFVASVTQLFTLSCSSNSRTVTSGGAIFSLQSSVNASTCQDSQKVQIATEYQGEDGQNKLRMTLDGDEGAVVRCKYNASQFLISLSQKGYSLIASGDITNKAAANESPQIVSSKMLVTVVLPDGTTYKTSGLSTDALGFCSATFRTYTNRDLETTSFTCPKIESQATSNRFCSIGPSTQTASFFKFANCEAL